MDILKLICDLVIYNPVPDTEIIPYCDILVSYPGLSVDSTVNGNGCFEPYTIDVRFAIKDVDLMTFHFNAM